MKFTKKHFNKNKEMGLIHYEVRKNQQDKEVPVVTRYEEAFQPRQIAAAPLSER